MPVAGADPIWSMKIKEFLFQKNQCFMPIEIFTLSWNDTEWYAFNLSKWQLSHLNNFSFFKAYVGHNLALNQHWRKRNLGMGGITPLAELPNKMQWLTKSHLKQNLCKK